MPDLSSPAAREAALGDFDNAVYADSSRATNACTLRTVKAMLAAWGVHEILPVTPGKVRLLGASLRAGRYRSFRNYLYALRTLGEREDAIPCPVAVRRAVIDAMRSCGRGLGGPRKSEGIPLEVLA